MFTKVIKLCFEIWQSCGSKIEGETAVKNAHKVTDVERNTHTHTNTHTLTHMHKETLAKSEMEAGKSLTCNKWQVSTLK